MLPGAPAGVEGLGSWLLSDTGLLCCHGATRILSHPAEKQLMRKVPPGHCPGPSFHDHPEDFHRGPGDRDRRHPEPGGGQPVSRDGCRAAGHEAASWKHPEQVVTGARPHPWPCSHAKLPGGRDPAPAQREPGAVPALSAGSPETSPWEGQHHAQVVFVLSVHLAGLCHCPLPHPREVTKAAESVLGDQSAPAVCLLPEPQLPHL